MCHAIVAFRGFAENLDVYDSILRMHDNRITHGSRCHEECGIWLAKCDTASVCVCRAYPNPGHCLKASFCAIISSWPFCLTRPLCLAASYASCSNTSLTRSACQHGKQKWSQEMTNGSLCNILRALNAHARKDMRSV